MGWISPPIPLVYLKKLELPCSGWDIEREVPFVLAVQKCNCVTHRQNISDKSATNQRTVTLL